MPSVPPPLPPPLPPRGGSQPTEPSLPPPAPPPLGPQVVHAPSLGYGTPSEARRPGGLIAFGIASLLIGLASLALNGLLAAMVVGAASKSVPPPAPPMPAPLPPANVAPYAGETVRGTGGLPRAAREALLRDVPLAGPTAQDRRVMLDRLLAEAGAAITAGQSSAPGKPVFTPQPATSTQGAGALWQPQAFDVPGGEVTIDNRSATFTPGGAGGQPVVVRDTVVQTPAGPRWSVAAIDARLAQLRTALPAITPQQVTVLSQVLEREAQYATAAFNAAGAAPAAQPQRRNPPEVPLHQCYLSDGVLAALVGGAGWYVLPDGRAVPMTQAPHGVDPVRGAPNPPPRAPFVPFAPGSPTAMRALAAVLAGAAFVGGMLAFAGVRVIGNAPAGAVWHLRWAGLKVAVVILEVVVAVWLMSTATEMIAQRSDGRGWARQWVLGATLGGGSFTLVTGSIFQLIYPAVVVCVLLFSRSVRAYYESIGGGDVALFGPAARGWIDGVPGRALAVGATAAALVLALAHLGLGASHGYGAGANVLVAAGHILAGGALLLAGTSLTRRILRARKVRESGALAAVLISLLMPSGATALQATDPAYAAARQQAAELLKKMRGSGKYYETFRKAVEIGEPAQVPILQELARNRFSDSTQVQTVREVWGRQKLKVSERNRAEAVKVVDALAKSNRREAIEVLELFPDWPELAPAFAAMATHYTEDVRNPAIDGLMRLDPSGKLATDAVREAMKKPSGGHDYRFFEPLRRMGKAGLPMLIELSYGLSLDQRLAALRAMRPAKPEFNETAADRAADLYVSGVSDLAFTAYDRKRFEQLMREEAIKTLQAMGERGQKLAADLQAGRRPPSAARLRMMRELDAPDALKQALFPTDPGEGVPPGHYAFMQELAALHKTDPRAAAERAFAEFGGGTDARSGAVDDLPSTDEGRKQVAARLLAGLPEVSKRPDDLPRLIDAARRSRPGVRKALLATLLGGRFEYTPQLRDACFEWLGERKPGRGGITDERGETVAALKDLPLGRRVLMDAMTASANQSGGLYIYSAVFAKALAERHPPLAAGMENASGFAGWVDVETRAALARVIAAADADPANVERVLLERLWDADRRVAAIAGRILASDVLRPNLGPAAVERLRDVAPEDSRLWYGTAPLVANPNNTWAGRPGRSAGSSMTNAAGGQGATTTERERLQKYAWLATAALACGSALTFAVLMLLPRGGAAARA